MAVTARELKSSCFRFLSSKAWRDHFRAKNATPIPLPWDDSYRLTAAEKGAIAESIQQFQLGEGSEGKRFRARGARWGAERRDPDFADSLHEFIREEQRHSAMLAAFMDIQGIPRIEKHAVDSIFRRIRVVAGLETIVTVLVSAEVIAVPYYRALRDATRSPLLRALCERILADEAEHLEYQGRTLALIRNNAHGWKWLAHRLFLEATVIVVWTGHAPVFRAAGYSFSRFRAESAEAFADLRGAGEHALTELTRAVRIAPIA